MELIIKNGKVVSSEETKQADILVKDGKITEIKPDIQIQGEAQVIDATGKYVLPGGVDVHTHLDMPFMGTFSTDDFYTGTVAAAFGGTTSIIDYVIPEKNSSITDAVSLWHEKAKNKAVIDYGFHLAIVPPAEKIIKELPLLSGMGITSVKCFLAYKNSLMLDDAGLFNLLQSAARNKILVCVHAENGEVIDILTRQYLEKGNKEPFYHYLSRPPELEGESVRRVLNFSKLTGTPVYFVHLSTKDALQEIKKARKQEMTVFAETCPQYLLLSKYKYHSDDFSGAKYVMSPPLRDFSHMTALFKAIKKEKIDVISTDHCPFNYNKEKQLGKDDFTKIPNGIPGIETRMPLIFNEMVIKNSLSINKFVEITCTKPAQIFGMKDKGDIKTGMDADIAIWDKDEKWTISVENLHQNVDYIPFEGFSVTGKPVIVLSKGKIIIENDEFKGQRGDGKFIKREISMLGY